MTAATLAIAVEGVGVDAPGLAGWPAARAALGAGAPAPKRAAAAEGAPRSAEQRRASRTTRLAACVAREACAMAGRDPATLRPVFASSHGDTAIIDYLCAMLASDPLSLSPTQFHNSVHNAPSGCWTIETGCRAPAIAISAGPASFATGLLEAATQIAADAMPVLLVAYDIAAPGLIADAVPIQAPFGAALVLAPLGDASPVATLRLHWIADGATPTAPPKAFRALADANPSAAALPLLAALAMREPRHIVLDAAPAGAVTVEVRP